MAEAVAGEGGVGVRGIFPPGLAEGLEIGFDLSAPGTEKGAQDAAFGLSGDGDGEDGVNASEAFGPGAAKELHKNGLGLVVHGVGGDDRVGFAALKECPEDLVAGVAGGLFEGFAMGGGAGGNIYVAKVERNAQTAAKLFNEALIGVGFFAANAVVDVDGGESDAHGCTRG